MKIASLLTLILGSFFCLSLEINAQDSQQFKADIDSLCSNRYFGRGYSNKGDSLAAHFLERELKQSNLQPFQRAYRHSFNHPVVFFQGKNYIYNTNKKDTLRAGYDYLPGTANFSHHQQLKVKQFSAKEWAKRKSSIFDEAYNKYISRKEILLVPDSIALPQGLAYQTNIIKVRKKLTHSYSKQFEGKGIYIEVLEQKASELGKSIEVKISAEANPAYTSYNVCATLQPVNEQKQWLILTAHYDHLGMIGNTQFSGANDNASGTAMLLALARGMNMQPLAENYNILFCFFAAEEIGLVGSKEFVNKLAMNPKKIKAVINLDLWGGGTEGITFVNGIEEKNLFGIAEKVNKGLESFPAIKARTNAPNSDHYPFVVKGIPAVFAYLSGGPTAYHHPEDKPLDIVYNRFDKNYQFLWQYLKEIMVQK